MISHWLGCAYIAVAYADGFTEEGDEEVHPLKSSVLPFIMRSGLGTAGVISSRVAFATVFRCVCVRSQGCYRCWGRKFVCLQES